MKLPGWMRVDDPRGFPNLIFTIRVWHPGFWLFVAGEIFKRFTRQLNERNAMRSEEKSKEKAAKKK